jgi:methionyl-tRNA formyltransferase
MVAGGPLRAVFFGTPLFAVPTLDQLLASRHQTLAVVTQPDRPRGRGRHTTASPVKLRALEAGLPVLQPESMKDPAFLGVLRDLAPDVGIVVAYGKILPEAVLSIPRLGLLNIHASLLPRYRGAAPIQRAVMAGERLTGVVIMRVVRELDAGPLLARQPRPIGPDETSVEVERDLARMGAALLVSTLDSVASGRCREEPQDEGAATYAPRLAKHEGLIDWSRSARDIHNMVRGLYPWPHAYSFVDGQRIILLRTAALADIVRDAPGTVLSARAGDLRVATGEGTLAILDLKAAGTRSMHAREFLAGHPLAPGARFDQS